MEEGACTDVLSLVQCCASSTDGAVSQGGGLSLEDGGSPLVSPQVCFFFDGRDFGARFYTCLVSRLFIVGLFCALFSSYHPRRQQPSITQLIHPRYTTVGFQSCL